MPMNLYVFVGNNSIVINWNAVAGSLPSKQFASGTLILTGSDHAAIMIIAMSNPRSVLDRFYRKRNLFAWT
jgi:hypothetical protein